ncbi:MAG: tetratricopeptide repeat protein [Reichenbachiella sp.]
MKSVAKILLFIFLNFNGWLVINGANIDSLISSLKNELPDTVRIETLNTVAFSFWNSAPLRTQKYGEEALSLSKTIGRKDFEAHSCYSVAVGHWAMGEFDQALKYSLQSLMIYDSLNIIGKSSISRSMIAIIYVEQKRYAEAIVQFQHEFDLWSKQGDKKKIANSAENLGAAYFQLGKHGEALEYYLIANEMLLAVGAREKLALNTNNLGGIYRERGEYKKALEYYERARLVSIEINNRRDEIVSNHNIGKTYYLMKRYDIARITLLKALSMSLDFDSQKLEYEINADLHLVEKEVGNYEKSLEYLRSSILLKDSLLNVNKLRKITKLEENFEIERRDNELLIKSQQIELLAKEERIETLWKNVLLIVLLGTVTLIFIIYYYLKQRTLKAQVSYEMDKQKAEKKIEYTEVVQANLQRQLDFKNQELTSYTVNLIQKSELFQELNNKINSIKPKGTSALRSSLIALQNEIKKHFVPDDDWKEFMQSFDKVYADFFPKLQVKFPELSSTDIRMCALLKINMSIKEMAGILGISPDSVKTARYRLRKKLQLGKDENFVEVLNV